MTAPPVCLECGKSDPPPAQTCRGGLDHFVGVDHELACPSCGRLATVCATRPCQARRAESYKPGWDDDDTGGSDDG